MTMRLVGVAAEAAAVAVARRLVTPEQRQRLGVQLVRELMQGLTHDHVAYMVVHNISLFQILPLVLQSACFAWLFRDYLGVMGMTDDEAVAAVLEARPDMADLVATPAGMAWLQVMISGRDLGL